MSRLVNGAAVFRMDRFLTPDDDGRARLVAATEAVVDAVNRHAVAGAWSGADPAAMAEAIEALDPLPELGVPFEQVIDEVSASVLAHSVRPTDPTCVAHLHSPTLIDAAATEVAIGAINQSMDSFDQAPAATLVEDRLVRRLAEIVGLPSSSSGVMTAGGTASNLLGLVLAREAASRRLGFDVAADGLPNEARSWRIVTSAAAHFSVERAAMLMGLGRSAVVTVATDRDGAVDSVAFDTTVDALGRSGLVPIAIVGTAGTTDLGAIDPLGHLADRAVELEAWFHVDAAVGGAFAAHPELAVRLSGIERADSVTVDLHKLWWQPISASALLVADEHSFDLIRRHSEYLDREEDAELGVLNLVGRSLDTSRRFDALKALVSLRTLGRDGMAEMLGKLVDVAAGAAEVIAAHARFELAAEPSSVMVVFRWVGDGSLSDETLDGVNIEVQRRLFDDGRAVIGRTRYGRRVMLKFTVVNPELVTQNLVLLLDAVDAEASRISR